MKRLAIFLAAGFLSWLWVPGAYATRGPFPHAYGTRATGLGGAFDAVSDDAISPAVYNPAGLTQIKNKRFDMDMIFLRTYQNFRNRNNNPQNGQNGRATSAQGFIPEDNLLLNNDSDARTAKNNYFIMGGMGAAMRISDRMVLGAGFVGRAGGGVFYRMKQSPFSFILPYDANDTPSNRADDSLVPLATTRRGLITSTGKANLPLTDSQQLTTPSDKAYFVSTEYSTDLKIPEFGPAIGYEVNKKLSVGLSARIVAGAFRFKQAVGTASSIMQGTGQYNNKQWLGGVLNQADATTYGELLLGRVRDPNLGSVQFGYEELQGIGRLENAYAVGFGWGAGVHYRPMGNNRLVLSASYKSRAVMDFKGGELMLDFSDQFRKFYYDTAQFGEFQKATFSDPLPGKGVSYLSNGAQTLRAPKFFNALLGTIDYPATQGNVLAQRAMEWFFNGKNKDGNPTLIRDANGYIRYIDLTAFYDPYMHFALPRELAFGAAWRPVDKLLLSLEYRLIYMNDMVGDNYTIHLRSGSSPFFEWMVGREAFDFSMYTDFNTIRSISVGAEYNLGEKWTIRGGVQHSNNTFTAKHIPFTFNMQPEDEVSLGCGYRLNKHWAFDFAGSASFTFDTTESKGTEKTGPNSFDPNFATNFKFNKGSEIDQFHSNAEFDHKQWQVNFGVSYLW